ncbi:unnamed protein product, partial [Allacma fusca]
MRRRMTGRNSTLISLWSPRRTMSASGFVFLGSE